MTTLLVSIIIPVFNEEHTILDLLQRVRAQVVPDIAFEVIVVDDGSQDRTLSLLLPHAELYDQIIVLKENGGKGAAVLAGLHASHGTYILFQDADLEYDPSEYSKLLMPVLKLKADIVMGSRLMAPQVTRVVYFWHLMGNKLLSLIFNILHNTTFSDIYSCFLLYRKTLVDPHKILARGWEQQAEILSRAVTHAQVIYEVPISYHGRTYAEGKKIRWHHGLSVMWRILITRVLG